MARLKTSASASRTPHIPPTTTNPGAVSPALRVAAACPRRAQRRPTKQVSYELANHVKAYLEAGQYVSGYGLLYSLLAAGTSISTPARPYVGYLAPPAYITFASSLIVDPKCTTKAQSKDVIKGADAALQYLQCMRTTIDSPAYPTIRKAFSFPEERNRRRAPGYRGGGSLSPEPGGDIERIAGDAANEKSLWYCAEDFWHIVGWAFNCACVYKKRWSRWKLWLAVILDFLEADWEVCVRQSRDDDVDAETFFQESLLSHYIVGDESAPTNRARRRRIVKAIFATGMPESLKEYPEIWDRETAEPKRKKDEEQRIGEVDFETGDIADYASDDEMQDASEDEDGEDADEASAFQDYKSIQNTQDAIEHLGGHDAIELRQRLLALLAQAALILPTSFTRLFDLCDTILEDFIQLPTVIFQALLPTMKLPDDIQFAFNANLLSPLISGKTPNYFVTLPTQEHFEKKLLSLKGSTQSFAANAKISLILEQLFMYMMDHDALKPTKALRGAMETGIEARQGVYGTGKGKRGNAQEEEQGKGLLHACSQRLLGLLEVLEIAAGIPPQVATRRGHGDAALAFLSFGSGSSLSPPPESETETEE
ncbi:hypothetical protein COCSADRAFT_184738 [Bipolaris sorokiniana ND90Pr]|uniref:Uncharacterized protein n=1 Tax=Cochliobolus sativus (strain ND90Pr / ATCC 201652) TaxID=665912 RepID=M2ST16_COCSN|nr:uncharacterized protein COCSADRAFT_184738 [Bipolaris sorokiniana ND90Pr]EMD60226.1 hypothetical protein COCSADRAFT_184738 [Bipolaris sorokiniana ND90Pr]